MQETIKKIIEESIETKSNIPVDLVESACLNIIDRFRKGGQLLVCGNGGSAADAQHMAGEFVNKFKIERNPAPCIALTTDTSILTAIGNDYSFDEVFSKQVKAYGRENDVLIGISTSGNSKNVIRAVEAARDKGVYAIGLLGGDGGKLGACCDLSIVIKSNNTPRIQESHILIIHIICEIVERALKDEGLI